jgi:hypothetical protein
MHTVHKYDRQTASQAWHTDLALMCSMVLQTTVEGQPSSYTNTCVYMTHSRPREEICSEAGAPYLDANVRVKRVFDGVVYHLQDAVAARHEL